MPQSSRKDRTLRKYKRERTLAYRLLDVAVAQRDQARAFAKALETELQKYLKKYGELPQDVEEIPGTNSVASQLTSVDEVPLNG